jgi:hypothetical protein
MLVPELQLARVPVAPNAPNAIAPTPADLMKSLLLITDVPSLLSKIIPLADLMHQSLLVILPY